MKYEKPLLQILMLGNIEVITTSGEWDTDKELEDLLTVPGV